jgi:hypothetical protein
MPSNQSKNPTHKQIRKKLVINLMHISHRLCTSFTTGKWNLQKKLRIGIMNIWGAVSLFITCANYIWAWKRVTNFSTYLYMCCCTGMSDTPFFILIVWEHQLAQVKHSEVCVAWWCEIFCPLAANNLGNFNELWYCC